MAVIPLKFKKPQPPEQAEKLDIDNKQAEEKPINNIKIKLHKKTKPLDDKVKAGKDTPPADADVNNSVDVNSEQQQRAIDKAKQLISENKHIDAENFIRESLNNFGDNVVLSVFLGDVLVALNRPMEALPYYQKINDMCAFNTVLVQKMARAYYDASLFDKAIECYNQCLGANENEYNALYGKLIAEIRAKLFKDATRTANIGIKFYENEYKFYLYKGHVHLQLSQEEQALAALKKANELHPDDSEILVEIGICLRHLGDIEGAIDHMEQAHMLAPEQANVMGHCAQVLSEAYREDEALEMLHGALMRNPTSHNLKWNTALQLLRMGHWELGFELFESRIDKKDFQKRHHLPDTARWHGESLNSKTILVIAEQGYGDSIQFVRLLPRLRAYGAGKIILQCPDALINLFNHSHLCDMVISEKQQADIQFDCYVVMMSLARYFSLTPNTIPMQGGYLAPPGGEVFSMDLPKTFENKPKIGLVWRGSNMHPRDRVRSVPLGVFAPILRRDDIAIISLQREDAAINEVKNSEWHDKIHHIGTRLDDFSTSASAISQLDLLIGVDTAPQHLAGALGIPTWMVIDSGNDWRWLSDKNTICWYESMRIFRQPTFGDWRTPISEINTELDKLVTEYKNE